ncbi:hypothetical protein YC2023_107569 [Brassica napus]|uniref:(rape) hypothetical protein n=1 Tax=Brassica napus TaxID=3708 RepID=A0A816P160_BRANA|nr:unnamed protein product [Brassica napus]
MLQRMNDRRQKSQTEPIHEIKAGRLLEKYLTADEARLWSTSIVVFLSIFFWVDSSLLG